MSSPLDTAFARTFQWHTSAHTLTSTPFTSAATASATAASMHVLLSPILADEDDMHYHHHHHISSPMTTMQQQQQQQQQQSYQQLLITASELQNSNTTGLFFGQHGEGSSATHSPTSPSAHTPMDERMLERRHRYALLELKRLHHQLDCDSWHWMDTYPMEYRRIVH